MHIMAATALFLLTVAASTAPIDPAIARKHIEEARILCEQDAGRLWGKPLFGPILFVDPATRQAVAGAADGEGRLQKDASGSVYCGTLPDDVIIANTATTWAGVKWTMILWPLPDDPRARASLMVHELFHRVQDDIGFP